MTFKTLPLICLLLFSNLPAALHADTDQSAAINCFDTIKPSSIFTIQNRVSLIPADYAQLDNNFVFAHGALGWHMTWGVLFDFSTTPVQAYETYGFEGDTDGVFGRMPVPSEISKALQRCGFEWKGLWTHKWPDKELIKFERLPSSVRDITTLPARDLLPPKD